MSQLNTVLFNVLGHDITVRGLVGCLLGLIVSAAVLRLTRILLTGYAGRHDMDKEHVITIKKYMSITMLMVLLMICAQSLGFNPGKLGITLIEIFLIGIVIAIARIADIMISQRILEEFESQTQSDIYHAQYGEKNKSNISSLVRKSVILGASAIILARSDFDFQIPLGEKLGHLQLSNILWIVFAFFITRLLIWVIVNIFLYGWYKRENVDLGKQYAYNQLLSYVIYFFAMLFAVHYAGINLTVLWAGAAALLVGIGIALQQVISDFFSGIVILSERSIEVGDFLDTGAHKGTVKKIGIRASVLETLENKSVIIPNSKLVNEQVINASNNVRPIRHDIAVGVAYGSDMTLVKRLMMQAADEHAHIRKSPTPFIRLNDFADSSLHCNLYFFTTYTRELADIKSDLRLRVNELFLQHGVEIPFPQRDLHLKSNDGLKPI